MGLAGFAGQKYLNLETFKKSGDGVKTPVCLPRSLRQTSIRTRQSSTCIRSAFQER